MIQSAEDLAPVVGVSAACRALQVPRSALYRRRRPPPASPPRPRATPARALSPGEKVQVREVLNSPRFQDCAPRQVYATLLDEGTYLCSVSSLYRVLRENREIRERRNQLRHPAYVTPRLVATAPNQVWTWDTLAPALQVQVSPSCADQSSGRSTTCMCSWTCIAASPWAGSSPSGRAPSWHRR